MILSRFHIFLTFVVAAQTSAALCAAPQNKALAAQNVKVENARITSVPEVAANTAAYLLISNTGNKAITLMRAESSAAKKIEIHNHVMSKDGSGNGMAKMISVDRLEISAHSQVELKPGGLHFMLFTLTPEFRAAQKSEPAVTNLKLIFSDGTETVVKAKIQMPQ